MRKKYLSSLSVIGFALFIASHEESRATATLSPLVKLLHLESESAQRRGVEHSPHFFGVIRFKDAPTDALIGELEKRGVAFHTADERYVQQGSLMPARIPFSSVDGLRNHSRVAAIEASLAGPSPIIQDPAHVATELTSTWFHRDSEGGFLTGKGVVIGCIDSNIDVFHPEFFHADGGLYEWVDVDSDQTFTPGKDKVVFNEKGELWTANHLDSTLILDPAELTPEKVPTNDGYQAMNDWIFIDLNGNGQRDVGLLNGFSDETPAFGEPIFIADDVNGNGILDPGEKLRRLKTSKIRAVYRIEQNFVRRRGVDLIKVPRPTKRSHATMTVGVLAGGHWSRPYRGVAPDAEIVLATFGEASGHASGPSETQPVTAGMMWLESEGVDIMMHEYGSPVASFGDGSSTHEVLMDTYTQSGIPQCTATHNFAGYPGHNIVKVDSGEPVSIEAQVGTEYAQSKFHYWTLRWREPLGPMEFKLKLPDGSVVNLTGESEELSVGDHLIMHSGATMSSRGTMMDVVTVARFDGAGNWIPLLPSLYTITAHPGGFASGHLDVWLNDENGYLVGSALTEVTTEGTLAHPSTADSAIAVGALFTNVHASYPVDELAFYSGRGPRIDGERGIDLVAPADGIAAESGTLENHQPVMAPSAGTSGALPQVTGVVALLLQHEPSLSVNDVLERLQAGARDDFATGAVPNNTWGYGKLSVYGAVFGGKGPDGNMPPKVVMDLPDELEVGQPLLVDVSKSTDFESSQESLKVRLDVGYDGNWTDLSDASTPIEIPSPGEEQVSDIVVEISDPQGAFSRRLVAVTYIQGPSEPEPFPAGDVADSEVGQSEVDVVQGDQNSSEMVVEGTSHEASAKSLDAGGCTLSPRTSSSGPLVTLVLALLLILRRRLA